MGKKGYQLEKLSPMLMELWIETRREKPETTPISEPSGKRMRQRKAHKKKKSHRVQKQKSYVRSIVTKTIDRGKY